MDSGEKKPVALKIWWRLRKGSVLNINTTGYVDVCVCLCVRILAPVWSPLLHSGNYLYQGLDGGERGREKDGRREKKKKVSAEEGGDSGFVQRTEKWEKKERGVKRLRSQLQWVFCFAIKEGLHTLNMSQRTAPQILARSQVQQKQLFPGQRRINSTMNRWSPGWM